MTVLVTFGVGRAANFRRSQHRAKLSSFVLLSPSGQRISQRVGKGILSVALGPNWYRAAC